MNSIFLNYILRYFPCDKIYKLSQVTKSLRQHILLYFKSNKLKIKFFISKDFQTHLEYLDLCSCIYKGERLKQFILSLYKCQQFSLFPNPDIFYFQKNIFPYINGNLLYDYLVKYGRYKRMKYIILKHELNSILELAKLSFVYANVKLLNFIKKRTTLNVHDYRSICLSTIPAIQLFYSTFGSINDISMERNIRWYKENTIYILENCIPPYKLSIDSFALFQKHNYSLINQFFDKFTYRSQIKLIINVLKKDDLPLFIELCRRIQKSDELKEKLFKKLYKCSNCKEIKKYIFSKI